MVNEQINELLSYFKGIVEQEKSDDFIYGKYAKNPDFIELDRLIKGIRSACKDHFEKIFNLFPDPTIITTMNTGKLITYNQAFLRLIETGQGKIVDENTNIQDLYIELDKRDQLIEVLKQTGVSENMEMIVNNEMGEPFIVLVSSQRFYIDGEPHILSVIRDVTKIRKMEEEIRKLSSTDKLTQVYNRFKIDELLQWELERSERTKAPFSIIIMDMDHLKLINETNGNQMGDRLLVEAAGLLRSNVRATDLVGRWDGEEFLILLPDTDLNGGLILAEKLRTIIAAQSFENLSQVTASFGVTSYRKDLLTATMIARANSAHAKAKDKGRNRVEFL